MKRRRLVLKTFLGLCALFLLLAAGAWLFPQQVLTVDSGPVKADAMVVLGGGLLERPRRAAELFKQGEAPLVVCSGAGDYLSNQQLLEKDGVSKEDIILEGKSHTTRENAEFTIALLHARHVKSAIIVTSWYHSRRALHCFEHYAPDIKFYSRPSYFGYVGENENVEMLKADNGKATPHPTLSPVEAERVRAAQQAEWKSVRRYTDSEYFKLLGYWVCYGVCPF